MLPVKSVPIMSSFTESEVQLHLAGNAARYNTEFLGCHNRHCQLSE